ncbi:MAG: AraC family transcriptional regulator [Clostridiales bacterium]|nr:AraC family transcriptional regulator [Clostridiales bacterium]
MKRRKKELVEYRPYDLPDDFPVLLLEGERWRISDKKSGVYHFHNGLEIGMCFSDGGNMEFEGDIQPFKAGDITFIPKNVSHTTYSSPGKQSLWTYIFFDPERLFHNMLWDGGGSMNLSMTNIADFEYILHSDEYQKIYSLTTFIIDELKTKPERYQDSVRTLLFALCTEVLRVQNGMSKENTPTNRAGHKQGQIDGAERESSITVAVDYIEKNYNKQFSIESLAEMCHLSETHFRRVFQATMGTGPLDFITNIRIKKACALLKTTNDSVTYISEQVGFGSISSFNRSFNKVMASSPREWRKQVLFSEGKPESMEIVEYKGWL